MDREVLLVVIPALIALAGTIITVYVGMRQRRTQVVEEASKPYNTERRQAYQALWTTLENVHMGLRTAAIPALKYPDAIRSVNVFLHQNALHLDREDQALAQQYVDGLTKLAAIVEKYSESLPQLKNGWEITAEMDFASIEKFTREEQELVSASDATRNQLLSKIQTILKAG